MQPKRSARPILFSALLVCTVAGCTPPAPSEGGAAQPLRGKALRVACPAGPAAAVARTYSVPWSNRESAAVEVVEYDTGGPESVKSADVWVLAPWVLPNKAAAGLLRPLPPTLIGPEFGWMDLLPIYRERLLIWQGTRCALPLMGEAPLCIYRADFLADPARAEAFRKKFGRKPAPPATWDEFADLAEHFRDTAPGGLAPSLPPLPADDAALDREFFTIAACYARRAMPPDEAAREDKQHQLFSFAYDHKTGKPRLNTPGFVYALNLMKRLQKCRPAGTAASPAEAFRGGQAALGLADLGVLAGLQKLRPTADKAAVCRMPGGSRWFEYDTGKEVPALQGNRVPYLGAGGWLAAVTLGSTEPDAAFSLLADLAGRERGGHIVLDSLWGAGPTRREQLDRTRWDALGLEPERTRQLKDALRQTLEHPTVQNPAVRLRTTTEAAHAAALWKQVRAFLTGDGTDAKKALDAVVASWEAMDREREGTAALDDYRVSVGLLPSR
jgi:multiple sugar transport system substrate-binding protein